jgi:hypothetical protein
MKLLEEPRIQKEIKLPKKVKRVKKEKVEGEPKVKSTILKEGRLEKIKEFIKLYKSDPYKARVKYFNGNKNTYQFSRLVLFEYDKGDFEIANFTNSFGISVTNKMYSSQKKESSLIYRKKKFWYRQSGGKIKPLTFADFQTFISNNENIKQNWGDDDESVLDRLGKSLIFQYFQTRFHWIKTIAEYKYNFLVTFNTVADKKLYGLKDLNRHIFKVPYNISKIVEGSKYMELVKKKGRPFAAWEETLKVLEHVDHLRPDMLSDHHFTDTCKMAKTLGKKVNCKWGLPRLKEEHDKWAKEITRIILDCVDEFELNIKPEYKAFAEFSGFKLLRTNKDMLMEGMLQNHCVGTYIDRVDRGECAIFHVDGYTLQVGIEVKTEVVREIPETSLFGNDEIMMPVSKHVEVKKFKNLQFRGKYNQQAPVKLDKDVAQMMENFVIAGGFKSINQKGELYKPLTFNRGTFIDGLRIGVQLANEYDDALPF